jgi:dihydroorotase
MHIARTVTPLDELLGLLRRGDLLTHSFRRSGPEEFHDEGILLADGTLREAAALALERGVVFDVGHGSGGFSFTTMEHAMRQGVLPGTISTDLHAYNHVHQNGPVFDLATTLSKFLHLGVPLEEAIRRTTATPAEVFRFQEEIGTLRVGAEADVAIFDLQPGEHRLVDSQRQVRIARERLVPWQTIKGGRVFMPGW